MASNYTFRPRLQLNAPGRKTDISVQWYIVVILIILHRKNRDITCIWIFSLITAQISACYFKAFWHKREIGIALMKREINLLYILYAYAEELESDGKALNDNSAVQSRQIFSCRNTVIFASIDGKAKISL